MNDTDILDAIIRAVRTETGGDTAVVAAETTASEVPGWDSLAHGRIILTLEVELGIQIDIEETYLATKVGELVAIVRTALKNKSH